MRTLILGWAVSLLVADPAFARPPDCPTSPGPTQSMPLYLDLNGLPGVPRGLNGQVFADVPTAPPGGTVCRTARLRPPSDVLRGEPGDLLRGPSDPFGGPRPLDARPALPSESRPMR
jgi:hypothetical protein